VNRNVLQLEIWFIFRSRWYVQVEMYCIPHLNRTRCPERRHIKADNGGKRSWNIGLRTHLDMADRIIDMQATKRTYCPSAVCCRGLGFTNITNVIIFRNISAHLIWRLLINAQSLTIKPTRFPCNAEQSRDANTHVLPQLLVVSSQVSYRHIAFRCP
jgi:hypothetical protein